MSLGIIARWRVRPLRLEPSIPREALLCPARPRSRPTLSYSTITEDSKAHEQERQAQSLEDGGGVGSIASRRSKGQKIQEKGAGSLDELGAFIKGTWGTKSQVAAEDQDSSEELRNMEAALERSHFASSVFVKPLKNLQHRVEARESWREHHKTISAQVYQDRNRRNQDAKPADWRKVLASMAQNTPQESLQWIKDGMKIDVPRRTLAAILDDVGDDKISSIRQRTGAAIKIARDESTLLLSGSRQAINRATHEFRRIADTITITRLYSPLGPGEAKTEHLGKENIFFEPPLSREEGAFPGRRFITHHIYTTPIPLAWTSEALEEYVAGLVDSVVAPHLHSPLYTSTKGVKLLDHERATTRRLKRIFQNVPAQKVATCAALKIALSHMCEKGDKYLPEARTLFVIMDRRGLKVDVDVFNILLKAAVKTRNLRKFQQILGLMNSRGHAPNLDTWLLFLRMFESVEVRSYILKSMDNKNILATPEAIQLVATEMAAMDAEHAVTQGKSLSTYFSEQKQRYGENWLTRDAANQAIDVFASHGRFDDAFKLLGMLGKRHVGTFSNRHKDRLAVHHDASSFINIILHASRRGKLPLAVNVMRLMKTPALARQPNAAMLHLLFEMAWKSRLRTTIVVIWRYACLARLTSWRMRRRVASLLDGKFGVTGDDLTESTYRQLGGEALARELAGGDAALTSIKTNLHRLWGAGPFPRDELGTFTAKALPLAFEHFGPALDIGKVLCQSILLDYQCLRAKKSGHLSDVLQRAKIKNLPLWRRYSHEERWVDLAPLVPDSSTEIKPDDTWPEEWDSDGWDILPKAWEPGHNKPRAAISNPRGMPLDPPPLSGKAALEERRDSEIPYMLEGGKSYESASSTENSEDETATKHESTSAAEELITEKQMCIINPRVWAEPDEDISARAQEPQTEVQKQNEAAILAALDELRKEKTHIRYVISNTENNGDEERADGMAKSLVLRSIWDSVMESPAEESPSTAQADQQRAEERQSQDT
ncbi:hypothetical protein M406DRAFT_108424 [Cryphonectria parasitica EP155]|uniref:Pentatricopeptide repeat domain-containing protein n=1 Tax=Cryphonectria parasitica (strain ATCC 38755 / EP155) TaxID=660469 RepID=A0A9P5CKH6_CRYP1|nr:uncharacterized protein M406DRAFT_108424 [Cryphonectria parasitica EP155]KAF3761177.1 hypothetical protein M406DRAFT_108424 [Cryphonectria parasitica EP155]